MIGNVKKEPVPVAKSGVRKTGSDWLIIGSFGVWALIILFTGFLLNLNGFRDMFAAFAFWTKTGTGPSGHEKPFTYWLSLLYRYEWPILLALISSIPVMLIGHFQQRVIAFTAFGTWLAYSLIPYKTPWLILNLIWPLALTFGIAVHSLGRKGGGLKLFTYAVAIIVIFSSALSMLRLNFREYTNPKEPYVYVQSTQSLKAATDILFERLKSNPEDLAMRIAISVRDPWPLPWVLSDFPHVSYLREAAAEFKNFQVVFVDSSRRTDLEERLKGKYRRMPFQMRDSYETGFVYYDYEKFKDLLPHSDIYESHEGD